MAPRPHTTYRRPVFAERLRPLPAAAGRSADRFLVLILLSVRRVSWTVTDPGLD